MVLYYAKYRFLVLLGWIPSLAQDQVAMVLFMMFVTTSCHQAAHLVGATLPRLSHAVPVNRAGHKLSLGSVFLATPGRNNTPGYARAVLQVRA